MVYLFEIKKCINNIKISSPVIWTSLSYKLFYTSIIFYLVLFRTHYASSYELRRFDVSSEHSDKLVRRRSPSLPPIYKQTYQVNLPFYYR